MSLLPVKIAPGINKEIPSLTSDPAWRDSDKIRFKGGQPEKIGGWVVDSAGINSVKGIARSSLVWKRNDGIILTVIGTSEKLYIFDQNFSVGTARLHDITPLRVTNTLGNDAFATTNTDNTVTVTDTAHGASTNDYVTFAGYIDGGLNGLVDAEVNANHQVTVTDANTYTFEITTAATATGSDGGANVTAAFELSVGTESATVSYGFGSGNWGLETWGDVRSISGTSIALRIWSFDTFGEDLVICHEESRMYLWEYVGDFDLRAIVLSNSPTLTDIIAVTKPDRHLVSFASSDSSTANKMQVQWADQETTNTWAPTAENTAGDFILSGGSEIMAALSAESATLIWTDKSLHAMTFIGTPFTFGFSELASNCGLISKGAMVNKDSVIFWMGKNDFYIYDGVVKVIPCSVHRHVFGNMKYAQRGKVVAGLVKEFDEVWWFYPSDDDTENDKYVVFNYDSNIWYVGTMVRTTWVDSELMQYPMGINSTGSIYHHENGVDDNGSAITAYVESAEFDIGEGDRFYIINRVIPDMTINAGSVDYIFKTRRYPHSGQVTDTTGTVSASTEKLDVRIRTRQMAIRIESDALLDDWRSGTARLDVRHSGRR